MGLLGPEEAWLSLRDALGLLGRERVPVQRAHGRVLAQEVLCPRDVPSEARATRDGYAVASLSGSGSGAIPVEGNSAAGRPWLGRLVPGRAVRVSTGAVIPEGGVAVVPLEEVKESEDGSILSFDGSPPEVGSHIAAKGRFLRQGTPLLDVGVRLGPSGLCLLMAAGVESVWVGRRPSVCLLPTGSELAVPGAALEPGQSFASHVWYLASRLKEEGARPTVYPPVEDDERELRDAIKDAVSRADLVVTTGATGPSDGDLLSRVLNRLGARVIFKGLGMRPGGTTCAYALDSTVVIGLPGGAGGVGVGCELLVIPAARRLQGWGGSEPPWVRCRLGEAIPRAREHHRFVEVSIEIVTGSLRARPLARGVPGTGLVPLTGGGWIHVPQGVGELPKGNLSRLLPGRECWLLKGCRQGPDDRLGGHLLDRPAPVK